MTQNIMGFKTEINYILKSSDQQESEKLTHLDLGSTFKITKNGIRTYVLNASIMFADYNWNILGMCVITNSSVTCHRGQGITELTAKVLTRFSPEESRIVSKVVLEAEKARDTLQI